MVGVVQGWGINNADYQVSRVSPVRWECPFYSRWRSLVDRCKGKQRPREAYSDCDVSEDFKYFLEFKEWAISEGFSETNSRISYLDKDVSQLGNKLYSKDSCVFIPPSINSAIVGMCNHVGDLPAGVIKKVEPRNNREYLVSRIMLKGKPKQLGVRTTPEECHALWQKAKADGLLYMIPDYKEFCTNNGIRFHQSVVDGIELRANILFDDLNNNRITISIN